MFALYNKKGKWDFKIVECGVESIKTDIEKFFERKGIMVDIIETETLKYNQTSITILVKYSKII